MVVGVHVRPAGQMVIYRGRSGVVSGDPTPWMARRERFLPPTVKNNQRLGEAGLRAT
jgi:hypothetical protein